MKQYAFLKDKGKGNHGGANPITKENIFLASQERRLSKYTNDAGFLTELDVPQTVEQLTIASATETSPLVYYATAENFPAGNKFYPATPKTVTLDVGDATFGRVDLILANKPDVVGGMGYITVSKGTPSANYAPNNVDLTTQYIIKWIFVAQNATVGVDITPKPSRTYLSEFINDGNGDATKPFITIDDIPIPKVVEGEYADMTALYAGQVGQTDTFIQFVNDASAHSEVTSGGAYFEYLGTTLGTEADYRKLSSTEVASVASSQADWNQTNASSPDYIKNKPAQSGTITTTVSITNATLTDLGYTQEGKVIKIANGANVINYTVNGVITASFVKGGTGAITFVQGAGRTLTGANGTLIFNGAANSSASIVSFGTSDVLYINNL